MIQMPFPHETLQGRFGSAVKGVAQTNQSPIAMVFALALSAGSTAVQGHCTVSPKSGWEGPVSLFLLTVCEPGEGKSTVQKIFYKSLDESQRAWADAAAQRAYNFAIEHKIWKEKRGAVSSKLRRAILKGMRTDEIRRELEATLKEEPKENMVRKIIYHDVTKEALRSCLHQHGNNATLLIDELGSFANGHMSRNLTFLNSMWSGVDDSADRKTAGSFMVRDPRLTCLFQAQPAVLRQFMEKYGKQASSSGFLARVLFTYPVSTQGYRFEDGQERPCPELDWFYERCKILINWVGKRVLKFTPEAQQRWYDIVNHYDSQNHPGQFFSCIRDFNAKGAEHAARIAAVLHAFETDDSDEISLETLNAAFSLVEWYQVQFFNTVMPKSPADDYQGDLNLLFGWITSAIVKNHGSPLAWSDILRYGPSSLRKDSKMKHLLEDLVSMGVAVLFQDGRKKLVGLPRPVRPSYGHYPEVSLMHY